MNAKDFIESLVGATAYRLWDLRDRSRRLAEFRSLMQSQYWSLDRLESLQLERLAAICKYAYENVEHYRATWGAMPQLQKLVDLRALPVVRKADIHLRGDSLISREFPKSGLVAAKTGGSTGRSLQVYFDMRCQEYRNAAAMRSDSWAGWWPGMLVAGLWGSPYLPKTFRQKLRNWFHDRIFYLDTMNLTDKTMRDFALQLSIRRPGGLFGHAHSLYVFARFIEEAGLSVPPCKAIIATSMMLLEPERVVIERVFGCKVTNRYGCEEVGLIASECEQHSGLHVNAEHVIVEILRPDGSPAEPGEDGEIVVTDLLNKGMPLIRYAIEDVASWASGSCGCGRAIPRLERLVGRVADFLVRKDGGFVAGVSLVEKTLTAIPGLDQMQIVQQAIGTIEINVVPSRTYGPQTEVELLRVMKGVFGDEVDISVVKLERIPQEKNGKYRFAICKVEGARG